MSIPTPPDQMMQFYKMYQFEGVKMMCVPETVHFILDQEFKQYVRECETCPGWAKEK